MNVPMHTAINVHHLRSTGVTSFVRPIPRFLGY